MANKDEGDPVIGGSALVQSCARMMSAAWLTREMAETWTAQSKGISRVAYALRHTIASDMGMGFELALKALIRNLPGGHAAQTLKGHDLGKAWSVVPGAVRNEIDAAVERHMCSHYGPELNGRVLPFAKYLRKHNGFLNGTVRNRYALQHDRETQRSMELLIGWKPLGTWITLSDRYEGRSWADGIGTLASYWYAVVRKALDAQWPEDCADRKEVVGLAVRAANQLIGGAYPPGPQSPFGNSQGDR